MSGTKNCFFYIIKPKIESTKGYYYSFGAVDYIFILSMSAKMGREMLMTMRVLFVCAVILVNNIYLRLATYIQNGNYFKTVWNRKKEL